MPDLHDLAVSEWLNADAGFRLASLQGRVVAVEAFQMLCPGCVSHGLPQARAIRQIFAESDVAVLGLHSVFEHHDAMTPVSLRAFLHEYRIAFPVAVDQPGRTALPVTMERFRLQGTPTLLLFDRAGGLRAHHFGQVHDMVIGAEIATLLAEPAAPRA